MAGFASILGLLVASHTGRDRRPTDLRLVAAAQYASACACGGDWTQLWRSQWNVGGTNAPPAGEPLTVTKSDYDAFERMLGDIRAACSMEDLPALRAKITPEMLSYFSEQLAGNASRGLINRVTDVKLRQDDLGGSLALDLVSLPHAKVF
jgi:predicted lipid-binding transport protein (Tim44 family)